MYDETDLTIGSIYAWNESIVLVCSCWAVYCLVLFYTVAEHDLLPTKPFPKFVCVKGVVFFTFAQVPTSVGW